MSRLTLFLCVLCVLSIGMAPPLLSAGPAPLVKRGTFDLREWSPEADAVLDLAGSWQWYPRQFLGLHPFSGPLESLDRSHQDMPGALGAEAGLSDRKGWGSYRVEVLMSNELVRKQPVLGLHIPYLTTSSRVWWNGKVIAQSGLPGPDIEHAVPDWRDKLVQLPSFGVRNDLVIEVSNYEDNYFGMQKAISLGTYLELGMEQTLWNAATLVVIGGLLAMAIYHGVLWLHRRKEINLLFFSGASLSFALRPLFYDNLLIHRLVPDLSWEVLMKAGFLTFPAVSITVGLFFYFLFVKDLQPPPLLRRILIVLHTGVQTLYALVIIAFPARVFIPLLTPVLLVVMVQVLSILVWVSVALARKLNGAWLFFAGFFLMAVTILSDIITSLLQLVEIPFIATFGMWIFLLFQSLVIVRRNAKEQARYETMQSDQTRINQSLQRFVPPETLDLMERETRSRVAPGMKVQVEMTMLGADFWNFMSLETIASPQRRVALLNSWIQRVGPMIRRHGGYIDHYHGNGFMAFFPGRPDKALRAANEIRQDQDQNPLPEGIRAGLAIHFGNVTIATLGEEERMDSVVMSSSLEYLLRLQKMTKRFGLPVLVSNAAMLRIDHPGHFILRSLGILSLEDSGRQLPLYALEAKPD